VRLLVDSHTLIWAVDDPTQLSPAATVALQDPANDLFLSAATIWEIAIKIGLGKLKLALPFEQWMMQAIADLHLSILPITVEYAAVQASLPGHHRDPFDRMLIAQALSESISVVGADSAFDAYGVTRVW
jgi:PIN domain nuclease of toxin-antitoxin system